MICLRFALLYFSAVFVVVAFENVDGGISVVASSPFHCWLFVSYWKSCEKGFFLVLPTCLNITKISLWTLEFSSTCFWNWQPNVSVLFVDNSGAKVLNMPMASDLGFNETFKIFKHWKYGTLLFAWPSNITNFLISLMLFSKENWPSFFYEFSFVTVFSMIVYNLHISHKTSLIFKLTVSRSLSVKVFCLISTTFASDLSNFELGQYSLVLDFLWGYFPWGLFLIKSDQSFRWRV